MPKISKFLLILCWAILSMSVVYGQGVTATESKAPEAKPTKADAEKSTVQTIEGTLEKSADLPSGIDGRMLSRLASSSIAPTTIKPEKLKVPEGLIDPVYAKAKILGKEIFIVISRKKAGEKLSNLYVDQNCNEIIDEKPVIIETGTKSGSYEYVNFASPVKIGDQKVTLLVNYQKNQYMNSQTKKLVSYERLTCGITQTIFANFKIGEKAYKLAIIDRNADGKFIIDGNTDLCFFDKNQDGKFVFSPQNNELLASSEFFLGEMIYNFKFDTQNMKILLEGKKLQFGEILNTVKDVQKPVLFVAKGTSYNAPQKMVEFKDGKAKLPTGRWYIKSFRFEKDGKKRQLNFRSYSRNDSIIISADKPYEFKYNLVMKYTMSAYRNSDPNTRTFRFYGYVYNQSTKMVGGKEREVTTRVQITRAVKYGENVSYRDFAPPTFTVYNEKGDVIETKVGKPLCWGGRSDYIFNVDKNFSGKITVEVKWETPGFDVKIEKQEYTIAPVKK